MDKFLRDRAWSLLPDEYKEEIRREYQHALTWGTTEDEWAIEKWFGRDNILTQEIIQEGDFVTVLKKDSDSYRKVIEVLSIDPGDRKSFMGDDGEWYARSELRIHSRKFKPGDKALWRERTVTVIEVSPEGHCLVTYKGSNHKLLISDLRHENTSYI